MKIKTSELTGDALDWAVAKCEGEPVYSFSTNWLFCGPIIERKKITVSPCRMDGQTGWVACTHTYIWGETPLIAAMRCYVASKFGNEVEIPDEIVNVQ